MSISGIGTAGYQMTGYRDGKVQNNFESGAKTFIETVAEKSAQDKEIEYGEKAFDLAGRQRRSP